MPGQINIVDIQRAAQTSLPLVFRVNGLLPASFPVLDRIIEIYLGELGQEKIVEPLSYCVKELISNAQKANAKRIYFDEHGLQLTRADDYQKGMKGFLPELSENLAHFVGLMRERRMPIEVTLHATRETLRISVKNGAALVPIERKRIEEETRKLVLEQSQLNQAKKAFAGSANPSTLSPGMGGPGENPYAAPKIGGEALIHAYYRCYGIDSVIARFSNVYGMYDNSAMEYVYHTTSSREHIE
jgi:hypothetical protein